MKRLLPACILFFPFFSTAQKDIPEPEQATIKTEVQHLLFLGYGSHAAHAFFDELSIALNKRFIRKKVITKEEFRGTVKKGTAFWFNDSLYHNYDAVIVLYPVDNSSLKIGQFEKFSWFPRHLQMAKNGPGLYVLQETEYQQQFAVYVYQPGKQDALVWQCNLVIDFNLQDREYYNELAKYLYGTLSKNYFLYPVDAKSK